MRKRAKIMLCRKKHHKIVYRPILHIFSSRGARGWTGYHALLKERATKGKKAVQNATSVYDRTLR